MRIFFNREKPSLKEFDKYATRLLCYEIRLQNIPRRIYERGMFGYLSTAFRADRISEKLYQEDLMFLKQEIEKAHQHCDFDLERSLDEFYHQKVLEMRFDFPRK